MVTFPAYRMSTRSRCLAMPKKAGEDKKMKMMREDKPRETTKPNITFLASYNAAPAKRLTRKSKAKSTSDKMGLSYRHCKTIEATAKDQPTTVRRVLINFIKQPLILIIQTLQFKILERENQRN